MTVELSPQDEQIIERQIREGLHPDAQAVVAHALRLLESEPAPKTSEALEQMLTQLRSNADRTPSLPVEAFDRESIYRDHD